MTRDTSRPAAPLNAGFDGDPGGYDDLRAWGHMALRRHDYFDEVVRATPGPVLELGSGTGTLLRALAARHPDRTFLGVEPLDAYVDYARERAHRDGLGNVRFEVGAGEDLGAVVPDRWAGLVLTVDTLHHVVDGQRVTRELARATRPGGRWRAMEPNRQHPWVWLYHVLTPGERTFPPGRFLRVAGQAGWRLRGRERMFVVPSGTPPLPAWAARAERALERLPVVSGAVVHDLVRS
ncbi:class I SAM-dependent methyltransferase [Geodermatophilus sp. SYSU D01045]